MSDPRFQSEIVPHLRGGYNLARWLTGTDADAEEALQEACLRAHRFLGRLEGDGRAWFYQIVRNASYALLAKRRNHVSIDDHADLPSPDPTADQVLEENAGAAELREALEALPAEFREVLILREWEDLSYEEIARVAGISQGTVMSRLSRARAKLKRVMLERRAL